MADADKGIGLELVGDDIAGYLCTIARCQHTKPQQEPAPKGYARLQNSSPLDPWRHLFVKQSLETHHEVPGWREFTKCAACLMAARMR